MPDAARVIRLSWASGRANIHSYAPHVRHAETSRRVSLVDRSAARVQAQLIPARLG